MLPTLLQHMSHNNIPYAHQYGFTKLRSTYDAIARFLESICKQYYIPTPAVFIDISKAYDRVWVHGLLHKLHQLNMPQGGVSAPQLFTIYIHDIVTAIQSALAQIHAHLIHAVHINLFADDIVIWISETYAAYATTPVTTFYIMQTALNALTTWASTWKVTFSTTKTQMLLFHTARCTQHTLNYYKQHARLTLSGFTITITDTYKYLGLLVHHNLSWTPWSHWQVHSDITADCTSCGT